MPLQLRNSANLLSSSGSTLQSADQAIEAFSFEAKGASCMPLITNNMTQEEYFGLLLPTLMDVSTSMVSVPMAGGLRIPSD